MSHYKVRVIEEAKAGAIQRYDVDVYADDCETTDWGALLFIRYTDDSEDVVAMFSDKNWVYFKKVPKTCRCSRKVDCQCGV